MAVQWDAAMVYTPGKTGFTAAGATGKGHPEAAQFICGDHNSSHHFEAFTKIHDQTYGKFHMPGGLRGSFSICYHDRF